MNYTDENRGHIQSIKRARQVVEFSGIKYGNATPTDIDGFVEKDNTAFVFFEIKLRGAVMSKGQGLALMRLVDAIDKAGKQAVLFLGVHDIEDPQEVVQAADAGVVMYYWKWAWHRPTRQHTIKGFTDSFMKSFIPLFRL